MSAPGLAVILYDAPPPDWDARLQSVGQAAGLLQSTYWGSLMPALGRGVPLYLEVRSDGTVVAQLLAIHLPSWPTGGGVRGGLLHLAGLGGGRVEFSDGPVFLDESLAQVAQEALIQRLAEYADEKHVGFIRANGFSPAATRVGDVVLAASFTAGGYVASPWATYLVDLSADEDALFMSIEHAARKGAKKAAREGVRVERLVDWEGYHDRFLVPYMRWSGAKDSGKLSVLTAKTIWDHPGHHDYYRYYVAIHPDGTPLAVLGMYLFGSVATEITSGVAPEAIERKIPAQDLLHWEMFLEAKREGCHTFNLAGVSPAPATAKEENIRRFKKKWGGRYVEYSVYEWRDPILKAGLALISAIQRLRTAFRANASAASR